MSNFFYLFVIFAAVFAVFFALHKARAKEIRKHLDAQLMRRGGHIVPGSWFHYPRLVFPHDAVEVSLFSTPGGRSTPPHTHVEAENISTGEFNVAISTEGVLAKIGKSVGMQDIVIGNSEFDDAFILKCDQEALFRSFLTMELQQALLSIKDQDPQLRISNGELDLFIPSIPKGDAEYDSLIDCGLRAIDGARGL